MNNIFFDLDGTLIDVSKRHYTVYEICVNNLGGIPLQKNKYWSMKRESLKWEIILAESGIAPKNNTLFLNDFIRLIENPKMLALDSPIPTGRELVNTLKDEYNLYLVSLRRSNEKLLEQIKNLKIDGHFKQIISGHSESVGHLHKVNLIQDIIKNTTNDSIIIGDTEADMRVAKALNLKSIGVLSGMRNRQIITDESPDRIVNSVADIDTKFIELLFQKGKIK